jgi:hypothetical protein
MVSLAQRAATVEVEPLGVKSFLPLTKMAQHGDQWAQQYRDNQPFPHIGIDDFFDDSIIRKVVANYPGEFDASWDRKFLDAGSYEEQKLGLARMEDFPPYIQEFVNALNSRVFVEFLQKLTGIDGLIPDPYLSGGGLHMIPRGGRLAIHADFNTSGAERSNSGTRKSRRKRRLISPSRTALSSLQPRIRRIMAILIR